MTAEEQLGETDGHNWRVRAAFFATPFIATLLWYLVTLLYLACVNGRIRWGPDVRAMAIGGAIWGIPVACVITLFVAVPLYSLVRRASRLSFRTTALVGIGIGLLIALIFALVARESSALFSPVHGVVVGFMTAMLWWNLAGRPSS